MRRHPASAFTGGSPFLKQIPGAKSVSDGEKKRFLFAPRDGKGFTISENLKGFQGPVLNFMGSRKRRASYLNELVIHEIRNNASAIFQNFLFSCCKIEFVQCGKNHVKPLQSFGS
jgi:hypothetical protein